MKKKIALLPLLLLFSVLILSTPCDKYLSCRGIFSDVLAYPGQWFLFTIPIFLLALTLSDNKHNKWLKFTGIFFGISMVLVYMTPEYGSGLVSLDRELVNWFLVGLYSFISIIYFAIHFFKKKKSQ